MGRHGFSSWTTGPVQFLNYERRLSLAQTARLVACVVAPQRMASTYLVTCVLKIEQSRSVSESSIGTWAGTILVCSPFSSFQCSFEEAKVIWVRRSANKAAHKLARVGVGDEISMMLVDSPTDFVLDVISDEIPNFVV